MADEPTIHDVLEAIHGFSSRVDERFDRVETRLSHVEEDVRMLKNQMVTKDYLDRKLVDLEMRLTDRVAQVDDKDSALVDRLADALVITQPEAAVINKMSPFPAK